MDMIRVNTETGKKRIRPDYEALSSLGARVHFKRFGLTNSRADGIFSSVYRGRSMEMEDLRPYVPGDNLRDMDWKASSRTGEAMVRNYVADKRKKILFIGDTGTNMEGAMPTGYSKKDCELLTIGTAAYLAGRGGADYAIACGNIKDFDLGHFRSGAKYLERQLNMLEKGLECVKSTDDSGTEVSQLLMDVLDMPLKGVSICLVTDLRGLAVMDGKLLRMVAQGREFYVFEVSDADWGVHRLYNVQTERVIPEIISFDKKLTKEIQVRKNAIQMEVRTKLRRSGALYAYLEDTDEIPDTVTKVLNGEITD